MITSEIIKKANILVVDDESDNITIISEYLGEAGYDSITSTTDPAKAKKLLQQTSFDLLLLDLMMPKISGFDLLSTCRQSLSGMGPELVITARMGEETRLKALKTVGVRDFLHKPFLEEELLARVYNLLEMHLAQKYLREHNTILEWAVQVRTAELRKKNRELWQHQLEIIRRLGLASVLCDNESGYHVIRVCVFAVALGQ